jgi:hypothetical protein
MARATSARNLVHFASHASDIHDHGLEFSGWATYHDDGSGIPHNQALILHFAYRSKAIEREALAEAEAVYEYGIKNPLCV